MSITNKNRYKQLCSEKFIPLFMQAWWMDTVCHFEKEWDVLLSEQNGKIRGVLVYHITRKFGFKVIIQPQFVQYNGVWIDFPDKIESYKKFALEKEIMTDLIEQLEKLGIDYYDQNFHCSVTNWQPFYWKGFKQTTRYSYLIKDISDTESVFNNFHYFKQRHIKKAKKKYTVCFDLSIEEFYPFYKNAYATKGEELLCSKELLVTVCKAAIERGQGKIIAIKDGDTILSAMFTVWDKASGYYMISAIDPKFKSTGASMLMVWEAILFLSKKTRSFDFEGSMIEGVAKANQEFGAEQVPYFHIEKNYSRTLSLLLKMKSRK